ncbi:uncharacterized protein LOC108835694 [Raphanus sativus]|uniref:Uncharacterized protein LOC108835694 n=1 Tax=Raphanus sativus TaxID=3726 RepID=A0A9W3CJC8_RAPSA|nr:uncharacterized protein LOC108835694 [Raphanus sativus]
MDVSEDLARDYHPRLYPEWASIFENKLINTNSRFGEIPKLIDGIGKEVWDNLKRYPVGLIARLVESKLVWSDPLPEKSFEPDPENYKALWELLNVPLGYGPAFDELVDALTLCRTWSADQRKWFGLLFLQAVGLYGLHHNSRIPFESAKRVFDDDAMMTYPWGGSYTLSGFKDVLLVWVYESVTVFGEIFGKVVRPGEIPLLRWGGSRTRASIATTIAKEINNQTYESCNVLVRKMVMKERLEELFPQWKDEADDPQLDNLIKDIHADRFVRDFYVQSNENNKKTKAVVSSKAESPSKKQKKDKKNKEVKINEVETAAVEVKESAKEKGRSEDVLMKIVAHLANLDRKFDSRLTEYDTKFGDFSRGLLDTIGDTVKATVEERLRVLGVVESAKNVRVSEDSGSQTEPEFIGSQPALPVTVNQPQKTPDKGQSVKNLADDIAKADAKGMGAKLNSKVIWDKADGVKNNLDSAFGNADATNADLVSDSPGKEPPLGRGGRGKGKKKKQEESELRKKKAAELKKKKQQEEAELNKEKQQEEADLKKAIPTSKSSRSGTIRIPIPTKKSEAKTDELLPESDVEEDERKRCGRIKEYRLKAVQLSPQGSQRSEDFGPSVPFPHIGDNVTTCMRKGFEPSPAIYDPLGPVDPAKRDNLLEHLKPHE